MTAPTPKATAQDLARELGIDAKALRVYLRSTSTEKDPETKRYAFNKTQVKSHIKKYPLWASERAAAKTAAKEEAAREELRGTHDDADINDEQVEAMMELIEDE